MPIYKVVLRTKSSVQLKSEGKLNLNRQGRLIPCTLVDLFEQDACGTPIHAGIQAEVEIETPSIKEAISEAGNVADGWLTFMSFTTSAAVEAFFPMIVYEITPNVSSRQFLQIFYDVKAPHTTRALEVERFLSLMEIFEQSNNSDRIGRAMSRYRKSLLETDVLDKFFNLWQGLESLNSVLQKLWKLPDQTARCQHCGKLNNIPAAVGIRRLIEDYIPNGTEVWKEVRGIRNGLSHSFESLNALKQKAEPHLRTLETALIKGVLVLLNIPESEWNKWLQKPVTNTPPLRLIVEVLLHEPDINKLTTGEQHPQFQLDNLILNSFKGSDGKTNLKMQSNLKKNFSYGFTAQYAELWGPEEGIYAKIELAPSS